MDKYCNEIQSVIDSYYNQGYAYVEVRNTKTYNAQTLESTSQQSIIIEHNNGFREFAKITKKGKITTDFKPLIRSSEWM